MAATSANTRLASAGRTNKHLQIQGHFVKRIFILQMSTNIVSLKKYFGKKRFQTRRTPSAKTLYATLTKKNYTARHETIENNNKWKKT